MDKTFKEHYDCSTINYTMGKKFDVENESRLILEPALKTACNNAYNICPRLP
jgi:hypothetical protein